MAALHPVGDRWHALLHGRDLAAEVVALRPVHREEELDDSEA